MSRAVTNTDTIDTSARSGMWSHTDDQALVDALVASMRANGGQIDWTPVAALFSYRSDQALKTRYYKVLRAVVDYQYSLPPPATSVVVSNGRKWSTAEEQQLIEAVKKYRGPRGEIPWTTVAAEINGRSVKSLIHRWHALKHQPRKRKLTMEQLPVDDGFSVDGHEVMAMELVAETTEDAKNAEHQQSSEPSPSPSSALSAPAVLASQLLAPTASNNNATDDWTSNEDIELIKHALANMHDDCSVDWSHLICQKLPSRSLAQITDRYKQLLQELLVTTSMDDSETEIVRSLQSLRSPCKSGAENRSNDYTNSESENESESESESDSDFGNGDTGDAGKWSVVEDAQLIHFATKHDKGGQVCWKMFMSEVFPHRTHRQLQYRWYRVLKPRLQEQTRHQHVEDCNNCTPMDDGGDADCSTSNAVHPPSATTHRNKNGQSWSSEDDALLAQSVALHRTAHGQIAWKDFMHLFPTRSFDSLAARWRVLRRRNSLPAARKRAGRSEEIDGSMSDEDDGKRHKARSLSHSPSKQRQHTTSSAPWTSEDDTALIDAAARHRNDNGTVAWSTFVNRLFPGRSIDSVKLRWHSKLKALTPIIDSDDEVLDDGSSNQQSQLVDSEKRHQSAKIKPVDSVSGVKSHSNGNKRIKASRHFSIPPTQPPAPSVAVTAPASSGEWTSDEDARLTFCCTVHRDHGNRILWKAILPQFPGRTGHSIEWRWRKTLEPRLKQSNGKDEQQSVVSAIEFEDEQSKATRKLRAARSSHFIATNNTTAAVSLVKSSVPVPHLDEIEEAELIKMLFSHCGEDGTIHWDRVVTSPMLSRYSVRELQNYWWGVLLPRIHQQPVLQSRSQTLDKPSASLSQSVMATAIASTIVNANDSASVNDHDRDSESHITTGSADLIDGDDREGHTPSLVDSKKHWTADESRRLLVATHTNRNKKGKIRWKFATQLFPGRSVKAVQYHYHYRLKPNEAESKEEDVVASQKTVAREEAEVPAPVPMSANPFSQPQYQPPLQYMYQPFPYQPTVPFSQTRPLLSLSPVMHLGPPPPPPPPPPPVTHHAGLQTHDFLFYNDLHRGAAGFIDDARVFTGEGSGAQPLQRKFEFEIGQRLVGHVCGHQAL